MSTPDFTGPELFDWIANNPVEWFHCGQRLLDSARILIERRDAILAEAKMRQDHSPRHPDLNIVWIPEMLRAMAIECLCKGTMIKQGSTLAANGRLLFSEGQKAHDLVGLVSEVDYPEFKDIEEILFRLTVISLATARYPVPTSWTMRKPSLNQDWGFHDMLSWSSAYDQKLDRLIEWLKRQIIPNLVFLP